MGKDAMPRETRLTLSARSAAADNATARKLLPRPQVPPAEAEDDPQRAPGFAGVDLGAAADAVNKCHGRLAEAGTQSLEPPEDLFLKGIAARADLVEVEPLEQVRAVA